MVKNTFDCYPLLIQKKISYEQCIYAVHLHAIVDMQSMVYILYDSNCLTYCAQNVSLVVHFAPVSDNSRSLNVYTISSAYSEVFLFSYTTQHIATSFKFVF